MSASTTKTPQAKHRWSAAVTDHSDAMTLKDHIFTKAPITIARSLKSAAEHSNRRKSPPFRSAMSMLTFYINRAGKNMTAAQRNKLQTAKDELRKLFKRKG